MRSTLILLIMCAMILATLAVKNSKKEKKKNKQARKAMCIEWSPCIDGNMNVSYNSTLCKTVKPFKPIQVPCVEQKDISLNGRCNLTKQVNTTECGQDKTNTVKITTVSQSGDCSGKKAESLIKGVSKPCFMRGHLLLRKNIRKGARGMKRKQKGGKRKWNRKRKANKKKVVQECKYSMSTWSDCDPVSNKKTMVRPLKRGDPEHCNETQTMKKACKRKPKSSKCVYKKTRWSDCDGTTNIKKMEKTLKRGGPNCEKTQIKEKICKRKHRGLQKTNVCKYKKVGKWNDCDPATGFKSREMTLKRGGHKCQQTKTIKKKCRQMKPKREKDCVYDKTKWGPCNAASNRVSRTHRLKSGDPTVCNRTKTETRKCKDKHLRPHLCKYKRTTWGECDTSINMRKMVKTLKRGDPSHCAGTMTIERKCKRRPKPNVCKYKYEAWTDCDQTTNTMTRQQILKSGPASCPAVKEYSKRCKKPCRFVKSEWSACDPQTFQMTRTEMLSPGSNEDICPPSRVLTKKCGKKAKCVYNYGMWSDCDSSDKPKRSRTQKLISGDDQCEPEIVTIKFCKKPNGKVRCFFGPWQEYDQCKNGVQKKRRQVLQGGLECELKGVKMKACD